MTVIRTALVLGLVGLAAAGCQTARNSYGSVDNEAKRDFMTYAGASSAVFVDVRSSPFPQGAPATAAKVAEVLTEGSYFGRVRFSEDASAAEQPHFRIVVAFDTPASLPPQSLCGSGLQALPAAPAAGVLTLHMAFCAREETLSAAIVTSPSARGLDDRRFSEAVHAAFIELFPRQQDRDRDRNQGVITF